MPSEEYEKMLRGDLYTMEDPEIDAARRWARRLVQALNTNPVDDEARQRQIIADLFGAVGANFLIEPPFYCEYGRQITFGDNVFLNFNCVILDSARVEIGDNIWIGPNVQIYTDAHPLDTITRRSGPGFALPIRIGNDVWIGGGAIICPGVTIGSSTVIGAGSVVTRDLPDHVLGVGNPCRVIRQLE